MRHVILTAVASILLSNCAACLICSHPIEQIMAAEEIRQRNADRELAEELKIKW